MASCNRIELDIRASIHVVCHLAGTALSVPCICALIKDILKMIVTESEIFRSLWKNKEEYELKEKSGELLVKSKVPIKSLGFDKVKKTGLGARKGLHEMTKYEKMLLDLVRRG